MPDLYQILGVERSANAEEIKKAYRKLSVKWHPDKNPNNHEEATKRFQEISSAYKILSDPESRETYNRYGEEGLKRMGQGGGPSEFNDILSQMFGGAGGFGRFGFGNSGVRTENAPSKPRPIHCRLAVSLQELYRGTLKEFPVTLKRTCSRCKGTGSASRRERECRRCSGSGKILQTQQIGPMIQQFQSSCPECRGQGKQIDQSDLCPECNGKEYQMVDEENEFQIYPGMHYGMKIVLNGKGHELRDQIRGDLVLELVEQRGGSELSYRRTDSNGNPRQTGSDLEITIPISLDGALRGVEYPLQHLSSRCFLIKVPGVITPKTVKCIRNGGMPIFRQEWMGQKAGSFQIRYGNLRIHFAIQFPESISEAGLKLIRDNGILDGSLEEAARARIPEKFIRPKLEDLSGWRTPKMERDSCYDQDQDNQDPDPVQCAQQ